MKISMRFRRAVASSREKINIDAKIWKTLHEIERQKNERREKIFDSTFVAGLLLIRSFISTRRSFSENDAF